MVATREAAVHPEHKRRLVAASGESTVLSSIFGLEMPSFNPMRVVRNRVVDEWNDRLEEVPTQRDELPEIGRMGDIQDIVDAVLYLDAAGFITGEILHVDGGANAGRW